MHVSQETAAKLYQILTYLEDEPRRLNMNFWGAKAKNPAQFRSKHPDDPVHYQDHRYYKDFTLTTAMLDQDPPCGTVACLAGTALIVGKLLEPTFLEDDQEVYLFEDAESKAAAWLNLTTKEADDLFYISRWPLDWQEKINHAKPGTPEYLAITRGRVESFIQDGR